jgi:hypothetical protein
MITDKDTTLESEKNVKEKVRSADRQPAMEKVRRALWIMDYFR